jgi:hypothetical protein
MCLAYCTLRILCSQIQPDFVDMMWSLHIGSDLQERLSWSLGGCSRDFNPRTRSSHSWRCHHGFGNRKTYRPAKNDHRSGSWLQNRLSRTILFGSITQLCTPTNDKFSSSCKGCIRSNVNGQFPHFLDGPKPPYMLHVLPKRHSPISQSEALLVHPRRKTRVAHLA